MFIPAQNFYAGTSLVGKDKGSIVVPCSVKFFPDVLCQFCRCPGAYWRVLRPGIRYQSSVWRKARKTSVNWEGWQHIRIPPGRKEVRLIRQWSVIGHSMGNRYWGEEWFQALWSVFRLLRHPVVADAPWSNMMLFWSSAHRIPGIVYSFSTEGGYTNTGMLMNEIFLWRW